MINKCQKSLFILAFILALFWPFIFTSNPVSAFGFGTTGSTGWYVGSDQTVNSTASVYFNPQDGTRVYTASHYDNTLGARWTFSNLPSAGTLNSVSLKPLSGIIPGPSLVSFTMRFAIYTNQHFYRYLGISASGFTVLSESCIDSVGQNIEIGNTDRYVNTDITCRYVGYVPEDRYYIGHYGSPLVNIQNGSNLELSVGQLQWVTLTDDSGGTSSGLTDADKQFLVGQINNILSNQTGQANNIIDAIQDLDTSSTAVLGAINNLRSDTQAQTDAIEQGNDDAQDRWEADKAEEAEREEQGQDDADTLGSTFRFEIRNPFMGLLGLFTNNCPVSIPTIAGMLGSSQTTYPCWFSSQTRGILTPVIGISASVLLFGFIVRGFLRKGNFSGGIEI